MEVDPITLATLWHKLDMITQQMGSIVERSARSPIFTEAHDFSCFVTDWEGRLVAQADGLPIHTGGAAETIKSIIRYFDDIAPGDVVIANDPYLASGAHLPDVVFAMPVYVEGILCFFAGVKGHHIDIGGGHSGGFMPGATEIYQEGLRIPPLRIIRQGRKRQDVMDLLLANIREPENVGSDFEAMIGVTRAAANFLQPVGAHLGVPALKEYLGEVLSYGERQMRAELRKIPNGEYLAEEKMQLADGSLVSIRVRMEVVGDSCVVDFTGTDKQIADPRNSPLSNTMSAVYAALNSVVDPNIPHNEGTYRPVTIIAPKRTIVNPTAPFPVATCTWTPGIEIIHLCWKALSQAVPDRVCGAWGKNVSVNVSGYDHETLDHFVAYLQIVTPGQGAIKGSDGVNAISPTNCLGSMFLPNVEVLESRYAICCSQYEYRQDGCGAGQYQGGSGDIVRFTALTDMTLSWAYEGASFRSGFGVAGGQYSAPSQLRVCSSRAVPDPFPVFGRLKLDAGDEMTFLHSGGGGWGDPSQRSVERVLADLRNGLISEEYARKNYAHAFAEGVTVKPHGE